MSYEERKASILGQLKTLETVNPGGGVRDVCQSIRADFELLCEECEKDGVEYERRIQELQIAVAAQPKPRKRRQELDQGDGQNGKNSSQEPRKIEHPDYSDCRRLQEALSKILHQINGTIAKLVELSGVSEATFKEIIRGRSDFRSDVKQRLQEAFGIPDRLFVNKTSLKPKA